MQSRFGSLASSVDSGQLSTTVQSIILGLSSIIILIAGNFGLQIVPEQIQMVAAQIGLAISSIGFLFGLIRKATMWWNDRQAKMGRTFFGFVRT